MSFLKFSILFLLFHVINSWEETEDLHLEIKDGKILGRYITSERGKIVKAFMGIPYAQPPVGELRFKAPQKVQAWEGIKRTQYDGNVCMKNLSPFGDEDCLYLNVYVPAEITEKMSVMVWIHGGGWAFGDGSLVNNGPEYILENGVILVSINYRLGPLGFLSTENGDAQGNFGLKDQQMALQWIQENIEFFGGDKNGVTIWGGD
jgi:carboxylesterase type B